MKACIPYLSFIKKPGRKPGEGKFSLRDLPTEEG